jgi:hypothetical protein
MNYAPADLNPHEDLPHGFLEPPTDIHSPATGSPFADLT